MKQSLDKDKDYLKLKLHNMLCVEGVSVSYSIDKAIDEYVEYEVGKVISQNRMQVSASSTRHMRKEISKKLKNILEWTKGRSIPTQTKDKLREKIKEVI